MAVIVNDATSRRPLGVVASAAVSLGAAVLGAGLNLVLALLVGRAYGAADTGAFFATIGVFLVTANVLKLGADTGLVRMLARAVALGRAADIIPTVAAAVWPVLCASAVVAAGGWLGADLIAAWIRPTDVQHAASMVRFLALTVPLLTVFSLLTAALRGLGGLTAFAVQQNVLLPLTRLAGVALAVWSGYAVGQAAQLWAAGLPLLVLLAAALAARAIHRIRTDGAGDGAATTAPAAGAGPSPVFRPFWGFALPRAASAAIEIGIEWLDVILVSALAGPAEGGLYAVATRLVKVSSVADYAMRVALSTRLSAALATDDLAEVRRLYDAGTRLLVGLVWTYLSVLVVFADVAIRVFGGDFGPGAPLLGVLAAGMVVMAGAGALQSVLLLSGQSARQLTNKIVVLAITVLGNVVLTPGWGARGAAVVWVVAVVTDTGLAAVAVRRRVGVSVGLGPVRDVGAAAIVAGLGCAFVLRLGFGPSVPTMLLAGLAALVLLATALRWSGGWRRMTIRGGNAR